MKKEVAIILFTFIFLSSYTANNALKAKTNKTPLPFSSIPDSVLIDTLDFEDVNDEYLIRQYKVNDKIVQMDIDLKGNSTVIDYILWDMDKNGRMEAIGVYNVLEQKYDFHLIEEELAADDLLEFQIQLEDIGFPSFFNSSAIPKAVYKSDDFQPELNYYKYDS